MLQVSMGSFLKIPMCIYLLNLYTIHYTYTFMCMGFVEKVLLGETCKGGEKQVRAGKKPGIVLGPASRGSGELWSVNGTTELLHLEARGQPFVPALFSQRLRAALWDGHDF